ncbi:EamA family transporter [Massilia litorea]|uniref:EamA family transporter n=1 Tax=Massilia litorea TaxID=2769491 RepID=A0A7L9UA01_9BURK|nr:EamA family transporter [Massilia litorea]QOL50926.1 EamA family transporter [Massilia litorea]
MTNSLILTMIFYSLGMAGGQLLFKLAAMHLAQRTPASSVISYLNVYLVSGLFLYGLLTMLWVWILRSVPLSKAYPFVALSFVFTPMLSKFVLGEQLSPGYFAGLALIAAGVVVIVRT